jgi:Leucine-rich repeat (LRR) protein
MKALSKVLSLCLTLILVFTQCKKEPEPVNITDATFLAALIENGIDMDGDGLISKSEAERITSLNINGEYSGYDRDQGIQDLSGLEIFVNLDTLRCSYNQIASLDISAIPGLKFLECRYNKLTKLDVNKNTVLSYLDCSENDLSVIDLSNNMLLDTFNCWLNQ